MPWADGRVPTLAGETAQGRVDARSFRSPRGALFRTTLQHQLLIASHANHSRHAIAGVGTQIGVEVLRRVVFWILNQSLRVAEMTVKVDNTRHNVLP